MVEKPLIRKINSEFLAQYGFKMPFLDAYKALAWLDAHFEAVAYRHNKFAKATYDTKHDTTSQK